MSKKLICLVLRHGDTDANDQNVFRSRLDPHLNTKGIKQAEDAAAYINDNYDVYKIISSPLLRALETADICSEYLDLDVEQDRALISWSLGECLTGKDKKLYADILDYYVDNPAKVPPMGEPLEELTFRTEEFFDEELHNAKEGRAALYVTHSSNILTLGLFLDEGSKGRQESEELVGPGGVMAVHKTKDGFEIETVFGIDKTPEFGS